MSEELTQACLTRTSSLAMPPKVESTQMAVQVGEEQPPLRATSHLGFHAPNGAAPSRAHHDGVTPTVNGSQQGKLPATMRVGWHDCGSRTQPRFTPRRRGGRDESVCVTVCLCACARAMGPSRGVYTET
jgi:hypothetical protein